MFEVPFAYGSAWTPADETGHARVAVISSDRGGGWGGLLTLFGLWRVRRQQAPYSDLVHLDVSMLLVTFAVAIAVSLLAGALPALRASRIAPALQLKTL